jgi:hypothetical protein
MKSFVHSEPIGEVSFPQGGTGPNCGFFGTRAVFDSLSQDIESGPHVSGSTPGDENHFGCGVTYFDGWLSLPASIQPNQLNQLFGDS